MRVTQLHTIVDRFINDPDLARAATLAITGFATRLSLHTEALCRFGSARGVLYLGQGQVS